MNAKNETKNSTPENLGRASYVHSLREKGVKKEKALALVAKKFACPLSLLNRIWARGERGAKKVEAAAKKKVAKLSKKVEAKNEAPIVAAS